MREYRIKEEIYSDGSKRFTPEYRDLELQPMYEVLIPHLEYKWHDLSCGMGSFNHINIIESEDLIRRDKISKENPTIVYHDRP